MYEIRSGTSRVDLDSKVRSGLKGEIAIDGERSDRVSGRKRAARRDRNPGANAGTDRAMTAEGRIVFNVDGTAEHRIVPASVGADDQSPRHHIGDTSKGRAVAVMDERTRAGLDQSARAGEHAAV
ncbi:hypothetical protein D3C86_941600 [compost metagenome]